MKVKLDKGGNMVEKRVTEQNDKNKGKHKVSDDEFYNAKCPICGVRFHLKESKLQKDKRHFCSRECFKVAKKDDMKGENNHQYGLRGDKNSTWKNGRKYTNYGYYMVYAADHPFANKGHYVFEHRLVAEKYLLTEENSIEINGKRYLKPEYCVHHKDFDRTNNDVSNLVVMTKEEHMQLHTKLNPHPRNEKGQYMKINSRFKFRKVVETAKLPTSATDFSAGYDMYAELDEPIVLEPFTGAMIRSGVAMSIPKGYGGFIFARSGISTQRGLRPSTCVSVIDADYRGEIGLPMFNESKVPQTIMPHERIAQIVFIPIEKPEIEIVDSLDETDRGTAGFGSTGR